MVENNNELGWNSVTPFVEIVSSVATVVVPASRVDGRAPAMILENIEHLHRC